mmetsp:Transcript_4/g.10  ORF Transcript_4/g.10 Transcript_4/m.10 type:complete len:267 (-) Transcript_4:604-1404(-)
MEATLFHRSVRGPCPGIHCLLVLQLGCSLAGSLFCLESVMAEGGPPRVEAELRQTHELSADKLFQRLSRRLLSLLPLHLPVTGGVQTPEPASEAAPHVEQICRVCPASQCSAELTSVAAGRSLPRQIAARQAVQLHFELPSAHASLHPAQILRRQAPVELAPRYCRPPPALPKFCFPLGVRPECNPEPTGEARTPQGPCGRLTPSIQRVLVPLLLLEFLRLLEILLPVLPEASPRAEADQHIRTPLDDGLLCYDLRSNPGGLRPAN